MQIFQKLKQTQETARQDALSNYYTFIAKLNYENATEAQVAELDRYMNHFRFGFDKVEKDLRAVQDLKGQIRIHNENIDAWDKSHGANEAQRVAKEEHDKIVAAARAKLAGFDLEATNQFGRAQQHDQSNAMIREVTESNPPLAAAVLAAFPMKQK